MAYKPVHIITNDDIFSYKVFKLFNQHHELGAEDYTEEEGLHYHYLIQWPINANGALSPTRQGAVKNWRRITNPCQHCWNRGFNYKCPLCGLFYKLIWVQSEEHHNNTRAYIQRKIDEDPANNINYDPMLNELPDEPDFYEEPEQGEFPFAQ